MFPSFSGFRYSKSVHINVKAFSRRPKIIFETGKSDEIGWASSRSLQPFEEMTSTGDYKYNKIMNKFS